MEWFALLIPILGVIIAYKFFGKQFVFWELALPVAASVLVILICKFSVKSILVSDTEYWGSQIVSARYYEYWETWVEQTCTRSYECGTSESPRTCTESYDCSYCDHNSARWEVYDNAGNTFRVSERYYKHLINKWNVTELFIELNRRIKHHGGCGKDGDAYEIRWDNRIESSESAVTEHNYTNKVQASKSAFKLPEIGKAEAKRLGLYDYPKFYDYYKQKVFLGLDTLFPNTEAVETRFQYFNGHYGRLFDSHHINFLLSTYEEGYPIRSTN